MARPPQRSPFGENTLDQIDDSLQSMIDAGAGLGDITFSATVDGPAVGGTAASPPNRRAPPPQSDNDILARYGIQPAPSAPMMTTFTVPTPSEGMFMAGSDLNKRPQALTEAPRSLEHRKSQVPSRALTDSFNYSTQDDVYTPPANMPGVSVGLGRVGDALSSSASRSPPNSAMMYTMLDPEPPKVSNSLKDRKENMKRPVVAGTSSSAPATPSQPAAPVIPRTQPVVPRSQPVAEILPDERRAKAQPAPVPSGSEDAVQAWVSHRNSVDSRRTRNDYDDFIAFAMTGQDPRIGALGFKYGCNPRNNPIMCGMVGVGVLSGAIGAVILTLPDQTTIMFGFGIFFVVVTGLLWLVATIMTRFWRRIAG